MKNILFNFFLGILLFFALFPVDIKDIPDLSADEVLTAAKIYSPECILEECG